MRVKVKCILSAWVIWDKAQETLKKKNRVIKASRPSKSRAVVTQRYLESVWAACLHERFGTSHVIAVSRLQWQHQARCVDVPGYLEADPPARLLTAASLAALTCQTHRANCDTHNFRLWRHFCLSLCALNLLNNLLNIIRVASGLEGIFEIMGCALNTLKG